MSGEPRRPSAQPRALTIEEFAAKTGYSRRTTERLIASGVLRSTKVGRLRRIVPVDLVALIEAGMDRGTRALTGRGNVLRFRSLPSSTWVAGLAHVECGTTIVDPRVVRGSASLHGCGEPRTTPG
ncbi:MAG: helix-turn-helix domain-containing protein [Polyangiaceae bacterium]|nr:helix-turn-helix domain-containing protein [Polyangiaceae bacterium]